MYHERDGGKVDGAESDGAAQPQLVALSGSSGLAAQVAAHAASAANVPVQSAVAVTGSVPGVPMGTPVPVPGDRNEQDEEQAGPEKPLSGPEKPEKAGKRCQGSLPWAPWAWGSLRDLWGASGRPFWSNFGHPGGGTPPWPLFSPIGAAATLWESTSGAAYACCITRVDRG